MDLAAKLGMVEKSGAWYSYNGDRIGQRKENAKTFLKENSDVAAEIEESIRSSGQKELIPEEENELTLAKKLKKQNKTILIN